MIFLNSNETEPAPYIMNGLELFTRLQETSTLSSLLNIVKGMKPHTLQSKKGNMFEKMWDILIKCGCHPSFPNDQYEHYTGNMNTAKLKQMNDMESYLLNMKVFGKGKGGSSDIILRNRQTKEWVFFSSKFYLDDESKCVNDYDVEKIATAIHKHAYKYSGYKIGLLVHDKQKVQRTMNACQETNHHVRESITYIFDLQDLEHYFQTALRHSIQNVPRNRLNEIFCNPKVPLTLRFHQELMVHKQMEQIKKNEKKILLGAKPRSGKTYCVGGLFREFYKTYGSLNALIVTPAPTETITQFSEDLFCKFQDFMDIHVAEIQSSIALKNISPLKNNIVIVSKQLLDGYVNEQGVQAIQQLQLDFIVFDENHFHGTTDMSKHILKTYSVQKTIHLFLTATYAKPLLEWNIPTECQFYWDIDDERMCKQRNITALTEKHGSLVSMFANEKSLHIYDSMPNMEILCPVMDTHLYVELKKRLQDTSYGFSMKTLFSGQYSAEVDMLLRLITGSHKEQDFKKGDLSFFGRIRKMSADVGSRTLLTHHNFTTQLWFLPYGPNLKIAEVSKHVQERMTHNPLLKRYDIRIVNSHKEFKQTDLKNQIEKWELKAKKNGKDGLILLAGNQLTLGITLPMVDIVFLMNDTVSSDKIYQMMYRCMTEQLRNEHVLALNYGQKKMGFVVDFNLYRVLQHVLDYRIHNKTLNADEHIRYVISNNLMSLDRDLFQTTSNKTQLIERLLAIWKSQSVHQLKYLLRKIEDEIIHLNTADQQLLNRYFTHATPDKRIPVKIQCDPNNPEPLPSGRCYDRNSNDDENKSDDNDTQNMTISLTKDVLPFILPLTCILTLHSTHTDFMEMLHLIKNNKELLAVFEDQSFIWWHKKDLIRFIEKMIEKYVKKDSSIYNYTIQLKMSLHSLIDQPDKLLEFIHASLKPKDVEKKQFGEVFTPMPLVQEMLDKLPSHVWSNPALTWFDPAVGMGNFMIAVYLRLMDGLKDALPDPKERKRHILEKMLFMSELNQKNVFVCKQIFDVNGEYKTNIHQGDTLKLDIQKEWGVEGFDVVVGNPPYNKAKEGTLKGGYGGRSLWDIFVSKTFESWLNSNGFLVFIHPPSWRKPNHYLWKILGRKQILYLKTYSKKNGAKIFGCSTLVDYYALQNTEVYLETIIDGQDGKTYKTDLREWDFLPSGSLYEIKKILGENQVIYSRTLYGTDKKNVQKTQTEKYHLPVVHNMTKKDGLGFVFSSENKGHFGIPKVILSFGEFQYPYNDWKGEFGMSQICFGLEIKSKEEGDAIVSAVNSTVFKEILKYTKWSTFQTDWRMFKHFKRDFWKEFV